MKRVLALIIVSVLLLSCSKDSPSEGNTVNFDRKGALNNWVNNIIIPAYNDFKVKLNALDQAENNFVQTPSESNLITLQNSLFEAQKVWQHVAMFEFGVAEENNYRAQMNTYPVDFETSVSSDNSIEDDTNIEDNLRGVRKVKQEDDTFIEKPLPVSSIVFDSSNSGRFDEQGFPTIDYLVNGLGDGTNAQILEYYTTNTLKENYKEYLSKVVNRMVTLTNEVTSYWDTNATRVINNDGSGAGASFSKLINDYLNYFEEGFREAKIATPSGKRDGTVKPNTVESFYSSENAKILFEEAYKAVRNFYEGNAYNDNSKTGASVKSSLQSLNVTVWDAINRKQVEITELATQRYGVIDEAVAKLDVDFVNQVNTDKTKLLDTFNALQSYVTLTKTNMFQTLNINVDFVDGDSD